MHNCMALTNYFSATLRHKIFWKPYDFPPIPTFTVQLKGNVALDVYNVEFYSLLLKSHFTLSLG